MLEFENDYTVDLARVKVAYSGNINDYIDNDTFEGVEFVSVDNKSNDEINDALEGSDLVFILAGAQISNVAKIAKDLGALTVAMVEKDINNDDAIDAYFIIDDNKKIVISNIIRSIVDLIAVPGLVNLDFVDVKAVLDRSGRAYVGMGEAVGKSATVDAVKAAIDSVDGDISKSRSLMLNILGATDSLSMMEVNEASTTLQEAVHEDAEIIWGVSIDESLGDKIKATLIAARCAD